MLPYTGTPSLPLRASQPPSAWHRCPPIEAPTPSSCHALHVCRRRSSARHAAPAEPSHPAPQAPMPPPASPAAVAAAAAMARGSSSASSSSSAASSSGAPLHADRKAEDPHPLKQRMQQVIMSMEHAHAGEPDAQSTGVSGSGGSSYAGWEPPTQGMWELMQNPEQELTIFGGRARSATDANVLRRKGHLKEQDLLIDFMQKMHETHTCEEVMVKMEKWITEHRADPKRSRLRRLVPRLGNFFTPLRLLDAFREYDEVFALSRRKYIPPNFAELRHVVNIAQVHASGPSLRLITFDADGTLYADGHHFDHDNQMIEHILSLMKNNVHVAIVTAAGYPGEAHKFEGRLAGLLDAFRSQKVPAEVTNRFHIMGGECNYLLRVTPESKRLEFVSDESWKTPVMQSWEEADIQKMLKDALVILMECGKRLNLQVDVIAKQRSVGIVPKSPTIYEVLEDIALTVQNQLQTKLPFCAFNGGNDVFVDVGNKSLGLESLMAYMGAKPQETMHVGDRFTLSGNDTATRDVCSVLWVANPEETGFFIKMLLKDIQTSRKAAYIE